MSYPYGYGVAGLPGIGALPVVGAYNYPALGTLGVGVENNLDFLGYGPTLGYDGGYAGLDYSANLGIDCYGAGGMYGAGAIYGAGAGLGYGYGTRGGYNVGNPYINNYGRRY